MKKEAKVIMLPTEEVGHLKLATKFKDDGISSGLMLAHANNNWCGFQHIYLTSDEEIKDNDHFMSAFYGYPRRYG